MAYQLSGICRGLAGLLAVTLVAQGRVAAQQTGQDTSSTSATTADSNQNPEGYRGMERPADSTGMDSTSMDSTSMDSTRTDTGTARGAPSDTALKAAPGTQTGPRRGKGKHHGNRKWHADSARTHETRNGGVSSDTALKAKPGTQTGPTDSSQQSSDSTTR